MSAKQQDIIAELNSEVESLLRDWVGDLVDHHDYDRAMAELQVVEAVETWCEDVDPTDLI